GPRRAPGRSAPADGGPDPARPGVRALGGGCGGAGAVQGDQQHAMPRAREEHFLVPAIIHPVRGSFRVGSARRAAGRAARKVSPPPAARPASAFRRGAAARYWSVTYTAAAGTGLPAPGL